MSVLGKKEKNRGREREEEMERLSEASSGLLRPSEDGGTRCGSVCLMERHNKGERGGRPSEMGV